VKIKNGIIIISSNRICSRHDTAEKFSFGVKQQSMEYLE